MNIDQIRENAKKLKEPDNLYKGLTLAEDFELPDNILLFYHDFCAAAPNAHNRYTMVFPLAKMHYFVDNQEYDIDSGDLLFIPPYSLRFLSTQSSGYQRLFITFQLKRPQSYLPEKYLNKLSDAAMGFLQKIFDNFNSGNAPELALNLWGFLTNLAPGRQSGQASTLSPEIARAVAFIIDNLHTAPDTPSIAAKVNMSVSNLRRRFHKETGVSIHHYISQQRLDFARCYLQKSFMRIEEIAGRCGFFSASSFSHFFIANTGMSPLNYRKNFQINHKDNSD